MQSTFHLPYSSRVLMILVYDSPKNGALWKSSVKISMTANIEKSASLTYPATGEHHMVCG